MVKFRKAIQSFLKSINSRVYFQIAPKEAIFPYLVYDITQILDDGESIQIAVVDIDGWDMPTNGDTSSLETLMETVNTLNKTILTEDTVTAAFYLDRVLPIIDDDKRIKRCKYVFEAKIFERSDI